MSYVNKLKYQVVPIETFKIKKVCAGCEKKQTFVCRGSFRVNANGKHLDVWMIYGCEKCNHTYNLPIYERVDLSKIPKSDYMKFLSNDKEKIYQIGTNKRIFERSRVEIAREKIKYNLIPFAEYENNLSEGNTQIVLVNRFELSLRLDKIVSEIFNVSRNESKRLLAQGVVVVQIERGKNGNPNDKRET